MKLGIVLLGLVFMLPASAATVDVVVRERKAGPIEHQSVVLEPIPAPGDTPFSGWKRQQWGVTGANGKVTFESVAVGRYRVELIGLRLSGLIDPAANSLAPPPQITIAAEGDKVAVEIEVWRGSLLDAQVVMDRAGIPGQTKMILRSLDGEPDVTLVPDPLGHVERLLLPGRYEMELVAPPGFLLVDVVWNGESLPGHVVRFDVRDDPRRQTVSWYLSSPSLITGSVADQQGGCPARVVATLVQPGPWIQAATQRGGSVFQVVPHQEWVTGRPCVYRLWLPDGQWVVQPQGESLVSSDPESAEVAIAPGETRTLDFRLTSSGGQSKKSGAPLSVAVLSPEGRRLGGATVEVWPPEGQGVAKAPVQTAVTRGYGGTAEFRDLAAGSYLVAAGRDDYLDGTAKAEGYDPKGRDLTWVSVKLREGARLHARAVDDKDQPVQGVELSYTRLSPLPKIWLADEGFVKKKQAGSALTDVTGHVEIPGLYSGDYRIEARMTGEQSATRFVLVRQGSQKQSRTIEAQLTEGQRSDLDLLVLPAASLTGQLVCSDRGTMSPRVSFRVFPAETRFGDPWRDVELKALAEIATDDLVLGGAGADRFALGPLTPGEYRLAARPVGQHYWSWPLNELAPDRASVFPLAGTSEGDTGVVELECGPIVAVLPRIRSKEPIPDLTLGAVHASLRPAVDDKAKRIAAPDVEVHADRVFLRQLSEGKFKTALTVEHPYLIPPSISVPEQVLDLKRGDLVEVPVAFDRVGGMVEIRGDGKAARLTPGEGVAVIHPMADGKVRFPGTIPGTYGVELCADAGCSVVTASWPHVKVTAAKTTFVP